MTDPMLVIPRGPFEGPSFRRSVAVYSAPTSNSQSDGKFSHQHRPTCPSHLAPGSATMEAPSVAAPTLLSKSVSMTLLQRELYGYMKSEVARQSGRRQ